ncbi:MAG TPA: class I SAM-dependent methyltransferase [Ktedonobacteraceae bacterium]|nr:class I SAM-dependent methyltransferase [Ktedonobacteraceae bacterium]
MDDPTVNEDTYIMDSRGGAEYARLGDQDRSVNEAIGSLFPPAIDPNTVHDVLDAACGPGGWALSIASSFLRTHVTGIDINATMISYAQAQAKVRRLDKVARFQVMDVRKPLEFAAGSFDLVNARFMASFLPRMEWSGVVKEFARVARSGGHIVLTESDVAGETNSASLKEVLHMVSDAMNLVNLYSESGVRVTKSLEQSLRDAGCRDIQQTWHRLDYSLGTPPHRAMCEITIAGMRLAQPFLLGTKIASQERLDALFNQVEIDMFTGGFQSFWDFLTVWGTVS